MQHILIGLASEMFQFYCIRGLFLAVLRHNHNLFINIGVLIKFIQLSCDWLWHWIVCKHQAVSS